MPFELKTLFLSLSQEVEVDLEAAPLIPRGTAGGLAGVWKRELSTWAAGPCRGGFPTLLQQALSICVERLGGSPEDRVDLEPGDIPVVVQSGGAVLGGGAFKHVPHGFWVCALGCHERQGGGAAFSTTSWTAFLALSPLDKSAAEFWARAGFTPSRCGWCAWRFCPHRRATMLHALAAASNGRLDTSALEEVAEFFASEASTVRCIWVLWL